MIDIKLRINEERNSQFIAIRSMFMSGSVKRMKDIEKLYPTAMAKSLRINHSRYIQKLYHPDEFTIKKLMIFCALLDLDLQVVLDVIVRQLNPGGKTSKKK